MELYAHRGYSAREPEMTRAAYAAAIAWAAETEVPLGLECDVHFSADDQLICLHDLDVDRTSAAQGPAFGSTVATLKTIDFSAGRAAEPAARELITLVELLDLVAEARAAGIDVGLAIETKHPNPRGLEVEQRVAELLTSRGWDGPDAPCRVISFDAAAIARIGELLPAIERTFLVERDASALLAGRLPAGVTVAGVDVALLHEHPELVARLTEHGLECHVWTVNTAAETRFCADLGVTGITTDDPDVVWRELTP